MVAPNGTNGGSVDVEGSEGDETYPKVIHLDETLSLYGVFHRLIAAILFPDPNCSSQLFHRIKTSLTQNGPLFREASRNTGRSVLLWTRRGSPLRALLVISIVTGVFSAVHHTPHVDIAFNSVKHIMRDVEGRWLLHYMHANGASMFLIVVHLHIFRGFHLFPLRYAVIVSIFHMSLNHLCLAAGQHLRKKQWTSFSDSMIWRSLPAWLGKQATSYVGTISLVALTGLLVFMLFFLAATFNAIVISLFLSLAAAGGFLALFFACVAAIYIGALSVAVFVVSATTISAIVAVLITTGWIGFFWFVWLATKKSLGLAKRSLSVTGSTLSAYSYARHAHHHQSEDKA